MPTKVEKKGDVWYLSDDLPPPPPAKARQTKWFVRIGAAILFLIGIGNLKDAPGIGVVLILVALGLFFRLTDQAEAFANGSGPAKPRGKTQNRILATLGTLLTTLAAVVSIVLILSTLATIAGVIFLFIVCTGMFNHT